MIFYVLMPMIINGFGALTIPKMLKIKTLALRKVRIVAFWTFLISLITALLVTWGTNTIAEGWTFIIR
ncbi:MAG: hypothetical protein ACTS5F_00440 [Candidatus Hodgkinia cicadicola]